MSSIREIAAKAKVSPGTVSRYLNKKGYMSQDTREKIEKVLQEMDYVPNELAINLSTNSSRMIGVILPDIEHPFFLGVIKKLVIELKKKGYGVILWTTEYKAEEEREYLERVRRNVVDGAVVMVPMLEDEIYQKLQRPLVLMDRDVPGIVDVPIDHETSGRLAAEKLFKDGCRNVLTVAGEPSKHIPSYNRHTTFVEEMIRLGGKASIISEEWSDFTTEHHMDLARKILKQYPDADGIYTADILGNALYRNLKENGKHVPDDFEIISTDGVFGISGAIVRLSAVVQPAEEIAKRITKSIFEQINGESGEILSPVSVRLFCADTTK